jgi:enamine deaminase RidA (YjgF/YER057c/UK114 family)|tara:strand:+ start:168 stop:554 length:387 start_codon:yes stop_codon:yes gene_type:complete
MTSTPIRPDGIAPPVATFAHAVLSEASGQILHTAGVVPILPDGTVPEGLTDQASTVWANVLAILFEASMGPANVVSVTTYVVPGQDLGVVMAERDRALEGRLAASTLVVVSELAQPAWKVEVAVIAID